jgi:hypothetical protein
VSRKMVLMCDVCEAIIPDKSGARLTLKPSDERRYARAADLCDSCMEAVPGHPVKRRRTRTAEPATV